MRNDDITIELSESIKSLIDSLNKDTQAKVLELNTSATSHKYFRELISISNSLEQYRKKEVGLLYVGLLGSYSSGKSSTINSLLNLWESKEKRDTSNNPTDDNITLITNESNVENVFTFSKEGVIPIRTKTNFQIDFLDKIVLMDTPGSGDPSIIEEIVRDSMPLCDLIIYTLNSTAPFTNIDKPFLIAQQEKLKNIPLIFVLTRGDEFRKSRKHELSEENFDDEKYEKELQKIISRISETIPTADFKKDEFILIDNLSGFNINNLKNKILQHADENSEILLNLHNHKLQYFKREIRTIHDYFLSLSKSKIEKCKIVFKKAEDNSEYFDDQIDVSKIKLRSLCNENIQVFSGIFGQVENGLQVIIDELSMIRQFKESGDLQSYRQKTKKIIEEESTFLASKIIRELESKAQNETLNLKEKILETIDFENLSISSSNEINIEFSYPISYPIDKEKYITEIIGIFNDKLVNDIKILKELYSSFKKYVQSKRPNDPTSDNILKFRESLREVMNVYYQALEMYNSAVFSYEVRTQVSELGLASEFDRLEVSGISRPKYNSITEKELSGDYDEFSSTFIEQVKPIENDCKTIEGAINNLSPNYMDQMKSISFNTEPKDYVDNNINMFVSGIYGDLVGNIQIQLQKLRIDISKLKKLRRNKYLLAILIPLFLFGVSWVLKKYSNIEMPTSLLANLAISVLCSILASLFLSFGDKYERNKQTKVEDFKKIISSTHSSKADELLTQFKSNNEDRQKDIAFNIRKHWYDLEDKLLSTLENTEIESFEKKIINQKEQLNNLVNNYKKLVLVFGQNVLALFKRDDIYLSKIEDVAKSIKHDSIEPSIQLLNKTFSEIELVKTQIEKIE